MAYHRAKPVNCENSQPDFAANEERFVIRDEEKHLFQANYFVVVSIGPSGDVQDSMHLRSSYGIAI